MIIQAAAPAWLPAEDKENGGDKGKAPAAAAEGGEGEGGDDDCEP